MRFRLGTPAILTSSGDNAGQDPFVIKVCIINQALYGLNAGTMCPEPRIVASVTSPSHCTTEPATILEFTPNVQGRHASFTGKLRLYAQFCEYKARNLKEIQKQLVARARSKNALLETLTHLSQYA